MKVIELLNRIENEEELPSKIRFNNIEWNRVYGEKNVCYIDEYDSDFFIYFFRNNLDFTLNDEIEVIEDKKIEKLTIGKDDVAWCEGNMKTDEEMVDIVLEIKDKINEIIDYINGGTNGK